MKIVNKALVETGDISRGLESWGRQFKNGLYIVLFFVGLYFVVGLIGTWIGGRLPDQWERDLTQAIDFSDEQSLNPDNRSHKILEKLMADETLRDIDYQLFMLEFPEPNAVAVPGGGIGVTQSLLDEVASEIGLAFVLAHELGHHQHRHITRKLGRSILLGITLSFMSSTGGNLDPLASAAQIAESGFSREQEREADRFAVEMILRKYGTTEGAFEFFEQIVAGNDERIMQKYVGSHPLSSERIDDLKAYSAELEAGKPE